MMHAQFRKILQMKVDTIKENIDGMSEQTKQLMLAEAELMLEGFNKIPDVEAENAKLLGIINELRNRQGKSKTQVMLFAAEIEKEIDNALQIGCADPLLTEYGKGFKGALKFIKTKLKELSGGK